MRKHSFSYSLLILLILVLAACNGNTPPPTVDPGILPDGQPKVVVTIETANLVASSTPTIAATVTNINVPTTTLAPTQTLKPYVGTYIGQPTTVDENGDFIQPPTIPPFEVQPGIGAVPPDSGGNPPVAPVPLPTSPVIPGPLPTPPTGSGITCGTPIATQFANAYNANPSLQAFGCPIDAGTGLTLVVEEFERGRMIWRDTREIIALANTGTFWRTADTWNEGLPDSDPALVPPAGLLQPVRGFGYAWRNNQSIKDTLGWATTAEAPAAGSFWQEFDGGSLFLANGLIYAVPRTATGRYLGGVAQ